MAITADLTDSEGFFWDFALVGDGSGGSGGQGVFDGQNDAYDGGLALLVNGVSVDPVAGGVEARELNTQAQVIGDLAVSRSFLVSDASISATGFCRLLDSFTNIGTTTQTFTIAIRTDLGSDGETQLLADSGGIGFVTDDANTGGADSSVGFAHGDNFGLRPVSTAISADLATVTYQITLAPGETQSLLSYAFQNETGASGVLDLPQFIQSLDDLDAAGLLAGLSDEERAQIVNYSDTGSASPNITLRDGAGNQWGIDPTTNSLFTIGSNALLGTSFGAVIGQNVSEVQSATLAEAGQEVNIVSTAPGGGGNVAVTSSYFASPTDNYVRLLVTISVNLGQAFAGPVGLHTLLAEAILVGDRPLIGGGGDGAVTLADSGVVIDPGLSANPLLSIVYGDYNLDDAFVDFQSSGLIVAQNPLFVSGGTSQSFLFYFSLNDTGGPGLGDLAVLSRPGHEALAGLSDAEIAQIRNFDLTSADRLQERLGTSANDTIVGNYWGDDIDGLGGEDNLTGFGSDDILRGGGGADVLDGGESNDQLLGGSGNDILIGGLGIDTLIGDIGNDRLDGGVGADVMQGGAGNDVYTVSSQSDVVDESTGSGTKDRIDSSFSITLDGNANILGVIERVTLIGDGAVNATGSANAETLTGNVAANRLRGGGGDDSLLGGLGDDTLVGQAGADRLTGGNGLDLFDFDARADSGVGQGLRDVILDFTVNPVVDGNFVDRIDLSTIDARESQNGNQAFTFIGAAAFTAEGQIRIFQNGANAFLEINTLGTGGAEMQIALNDFTATDLTIADLIF